MSLSLQCRCSLTRIWNTMFVSQKIIKSVIYLDIKLYYPVCDCSTYGLYKNVSTLKIKMIHQAYRLLRVINRILLILNIFS